MLEINLNREQFDGWLADLRHGGFRQGHNCLKAKLYEEGVVHCCLGVLGDRLDLIKVNSNGNYVCKTSAPGDEEMYLPYDLIDEEIQQDLAKRNDNCASFDDIAGYIETHLKPKE